VVIDCSAAMVSALMPMRCPYNPRAAMSSCRARFWSMLATSRPFSQIHPLYFLTIRPAIWNLITQPDPTLNRARVPTYRELSARYFRHTRIWTVCILEEKEMLPHVQGIVAGEHYLPEQVESIAKIRPRLVEPFRHYSNEDLLVTGVFLTAQGVRAGIP
jgi:hypothetical protein